MIRFVIKLYILLLIIDSIMSFFPQLMKHEWRRKMKKLCDYSLDPVRSRLPTHLPFDVSPLVVIFFLLLFIEVFTYLW